MINGIKFNQIKKQNSKTVGKTSSGRNTQKRRENEKTKSKTKTKHTYIRLDSVGVLKEPLFSTWRCKRFEQQSETERGLERLC